MIRVVVTGSECTGKTTLARALAEHFAVACVPEYARQFVEEQRRPPVYEDVEDIARGQIAAEDELMVGAKKLLVQDTDLLSTAIYSRHYYGACPLWIEEALRTRAADLYLLAGIDVPWVADGAQRDRGERRDEMQELFRRALVDRGWRFQEVVGSPETRLELAISAARRLL